MNSLHIMLTAIDLFNIAMSFGLVLLVIAIRKLNADNRVLRERNQRETSRQAKLFQNGTTDSA